MGVPAFFRWLSRKYPSIVVTCIEEKGKILNGVKIPVDSSQPNPNRVEFDNLYLDMNGIIHPCCHPENKPAPKNEDEMMAAIFEYIDRIFSIVRPRRLLYMAIDGVAPRAKMNQQRSRRFRASKETVEKVEEISRIRDELESKGAELPPEKPKGEHFDSNCITPGTPFMDRLAKCLHYYVHDRLNTDPGWRNIKVVLSDANVPGEGEHKIMDFIRKQRANPDHDANTRHCLCGADADLIMLGLATHEPNFTIIREEFKPNQARPCEICGQTGHEMKDCTGAAKEKQGEFDELEKPIETEVEFIFIRLNVLREYLERELTMPNLPFEFDLERVIDDWVFMCFFVGNDFLPHLPSLEIREGAIDRLVNLYKKTVYKTGGFLTDSGQVDLTRVQLILTDLGEVEDEIFKRRQENELSFRQKQKDRKKRAKLMNDKPAWRPGGQFSPLPIGKSPSPVQNARQEAYHMRMQSSSFHKSSSNHISDNNRASEALRSMLKQNDSNPGEQSQTSGVKRKHEDDSSDEEPPDDVRLWEDGWKDRYYEVKFEVSKENFTFRDKVAAAYVEGLCWVLRYYYQGCASWKWFFPYHYAPFASDFINVGDLHINFEKGTQPFKPLEQLMGVFPAASKQHVPDPWADLMMDPESPIIDFYPDDFKIDLNGKKYAWQGVALLPFVEERRLLKALESVYPLLTNEEKRRNTRGSDRFYVRQGHLGYDYLLGLYENGKNNNMEIDINPKLFCGIRGVVMLSDDVIGPDEVVKCPVVGLPDTPGNAAICVRYSDPKYPEDFLFPAVRLANAVDPPKVLKPGEMPNSGTRQWRPQIGMAPSNQRASLNMSGHRMLSRNLNAGKGGYSQVPPPNNYISGGHFLPAQVPLPVSTGLMTGAHGIPHQRGWQQSVDTSQRSWLPQGYARDPRDYSNSRGTTGHWGPVRATHSNSGDSPVGRWGPVNPSSLTSRDSRNSWMRTQGTQGNGRDYRDVRGGERDHNRQHSWTGRSDYTNHPPAHLRSYYSDPSRPSYGRH